MKRHAVATVFALGLLLLSSLASAQNPFTGSLRIAYTADAPATLALYQFNGYQMAQVADLEKTTAGFQLTKELPQGVYFAGESDGEWPVVLAENQTVLATHDGTSPQFNSGTESARYWALWQGSDSLNNSLRSRFQQAQQELDEEALNAFLETMIQEYDQYYLTAAQQGGITGTAALLRNFPSYSNVGQAFANEAAYFAATYFNRLDFSQPLLSAIPEFHFYVQQFTSNSSNIDGLTDTELLTMVEKTLSKLTPGSLTHQTFLLDLLLGQQQSDAPGEVFFAYANRFAEQYPTHEMAGPLKEAAQKAAATRLGSPAPDFTGETPDGKKLALSDLRGKYVLIDFWASWCGPCRMENPNVVRMYGEYSARGFEILGVSLDQEKGRWIEAIDADQLGWRHVSDLAGWDSQFAKLYGVQAIPMTFLIDPQGNIVAKGLRGEALEAKLAELLP